MKEGVVNQEKLAARLRARESKTQKEQKKVALKAELDKLNAEQAKLKTYARKLQKEIDALS
jgi:cell division protein FtsB